MTSTTGSVTNGTICTTGSTSSTCDGSFTDSSSTFNFLADLSLSSIFSSKPASNSSRVLFFYSFDSYDASSNFASSTDASTTSAAGSGSAGAATGGCVTECYDAFAGDFMASYD